LGQDWFENIAVGWRGDPEMNGGGFLYDSGAHLLDAVLWAHGGTPTEVSADVSLSDPDNHRADAESTLTIGFDDGSRAVLSFSGRAPGWHERAAGWDEAGRVVVEEQEVTVDDWGEEPYSPDVEVSDWDHQSKGKVAAFAAAVRTGEAPPATARDGLRAVAVTEAAYESGRTGEPVDVDIDH
jgi:predicted dehydrogenase